MKKLMLLLIVVLTSLLLVSTVSAFQVVGERGDVAEVEVYVLDGFNAFLMRFFNSFKTQAAGLVDYGPGETAYIQLEFYGKSGVNSDEIYNVNVVVDGPQDNVYGVPLTSAQKQALGTPGQYVFMDFSFVVPSELGTYALTAYVKSYGGSTLITEAGGWESFEVLGGLPPCSGTWGPWSSWTGCADGKQVRTRVYDCGGTQTEDKDCTASTGGHCVNDDDCNSGLVCTNNKCDQPTPPPPPEEPETPDNGDGDEVPDDTSEYPSVECSAPSRDKLCYEAGCYFSGRQVPCCDGFVEMYVSDRSSPLVGKKYCVTEGKKDPLTNETVGDAKRDQEQEELGCVEREKPFYTDARMSTEDKITVLFIPVWKDVSDGEVRADDADELITGFSSRYYIDIESACCDNLEPVFLDEKTVEKEGGAIFPVGAYSVKSLTYSKYKCVEEGEAGFCFPFAQKLRPYTGMSDCQTNTLVLVGLFLVGMIVFARFMG